MTKQKLKRKTNKQRNKQTRLLVMIYNKIRLEHWDQIMSTSMPLIALELPFLPNLNFVLTYFQKGRFSFFFCNVS